MRIAIGGDFVLNDELEPVGGAWLGGGSAPGLDELRDVFSSADFAVVDFEASLPDPGWPRDPSKILIRASGVSIAVARAVGVRAVTLANNHTFDLGTTTRDALEREGIGCFGAGGDARAAAEPLRCRIGDEEVAFVGWVDRRTIYGIWADGERGGANAVPPEELIEQVRRLSHEVDRTLVLPHWGRDYVKYPSPELRALARSLIEAGASAVVGTHPHVIGCHEIHRDRPIVYSTGSLLLSDILQPDGTRVACPPFVSVVALLDFHGGRIDVDFATFRCARGRFRALARRRGRAILERNSRFLRHADYARRYARYEGRMRAWGIRVRNDLLSRPGAAAVRYGRRLRQRLSRS